MIKLVKSRLRIVALATLVLASTLSTPAPSEAFHDEFTTSCPELTDSIYRLYKAVFLRDPDLAGFDTWVENYASGGWHLLRIAQFFTDSPEFQDRYGALDNAEFVNLIYTNVLGRAPDADGLTFWINELNNGLTRGGLLLFFSESEEYVEGTGTYYPLAGFLRSYSPTTLWDCGVADFDVLLPSPRQYWDVFIVNESGVDVRVEMFLLDANSQPIATSEIVTLPTDTYFFQWNLDASTLTPSGSQTHGVRFDVLDDQQFVHVAAVGTDRLMPSDRPGWSGLNGVEEPSLLAAFGLSSD